MRRTRVDARIFRETEVLNAPIPPLQPYIRCACGACRECKDNEKWDRVFAKFEVKDTEMGRGFRSPLSDF